MATYLELSQFARSSEFADRCTIGVARYARKILDTDLKAEANYRRKYDWARIAILNPRGIAAGLLETIVIDTNFAAMTPAQLAAIPDSGAGSLQAVIEATVNSTVLQY